MHYFTAATVVAATLLGTHGVAATYAHFEKAHCDDVTMHTPWYSYQAINQGGLCTNIGSGACAYFADGLTPAEGGEQLRCAPRKYRTPGASVLSVGMGKVKPGVTCTFFDDSNCTGGAFQAAPKQEYECFEAADGTPFRSFRCE